MYLNEKYLKKEAIKQRATNVLPETNLNEPVS